MTHNILLTGCGMMGSALLKGWLKAGLAQKIVVIEPSPPPPLFAAEASVQWLAKSMDIPAGFKPDAVVLAIKPQVMDSVLAAYKNFTGTSLFLSIAAGRTLASYVNILGDKAAIIRAMPNLPASIGMGASVGIAGPQVTEAQKTLAGRILGVVGSFAWTEDEAIIDIVTGVSGSGPAYVFMLVETMAAAGEKLGLSKDIAMALARQTVVGTGALLQQNTHSTGELIEDMTRIKGTTEAAVNVLLENDAFKRLMTDAIAAAARRSKELAR